MALDAVMEQLAETNGEIVVHTRNSRRHLLEMKKETFKIAFGIERLVDIFSENALADLEQQRELLRMLKGLKDKPEGPDRNVESDRVGDSSLLGDLGFLAALGALAGTLTGLVKGYVTGVVKLLDDFVLKPIRALFTTSGNLLRGTSERILKIFKFDEIFEAMRMNIVTRFSNAVTRTGDAIVDSLRAFRATFVEGTLIQRVIDAMKGPMNFIQDAFAKGVDLIRPLLGGETSIFGRIAGYFNEFFMLTDEAASTARKIGNTITAPFRGVMSALDSFSPFFDSFKLIGQTLGRFLVPIGVIISIFDAGKESMDAFTKTEGNIFQKVLSGLIGAIGGIIDGLVFQLADLLKDGLAWVAGAVGFKNIEEKLNSFSFSEMFNEVLDAIYEFVSAPIDMIKELFQDGKALIMNIGSDLVPNPDEFIKPILRSVLPIPGEQDNAVMSWIKKAVSAVIPDGVYEYAGLNPDTGELTIPEAAVPSTIGTDIADTSAENMQLLQDENNELLRQYLEKDQNIIVNVPPQVNETKVTPIPVPAKPQKIDPMLLNMAVGG